MQCYNLFKRDSIRGQTRKVMGPIYRTYFSGYFSVPEKNITHSVSTQYKYRQSYFRSSCFSHNRFYSMSSQPRVLTGNIIKEKKKGKKKVNY